MKLKNTLISLSAMLLLALSSSAADGPGPVASSKASVPRYENIKTISVTATVESIDIATRHIVLRTEDGLKSEFSISPDVKRLNEVSTGDTIKVEYVSSVLAELRPPTAEEKGEPHSLVEADMRTAGEVAPGGVIAREIRAVTTVEILDRISKTITVMGPHGNLVTADVKNVDRFKDVHIGDTIVITYTEAVALMLEKLPPAKKAP